MCGCLSVWVVVMYIQEATTNYIEEMPSGFPHWRDMWCFEQPFIPVLTHSLNRSPTHTQSHTLAYLTSHLFPLLSFLVNSPHSASRHVYPPSQAVRIESNEQVSKRVVCMSVCMYARCRDVYVCM